MTRIGLQVDHRKSITRRLAVLEASQRATAKALGVDEITVARDLGKKRGATDVAPRELEVASEQVGNVADATNVAPAHIQVSGEDAAKKIEKSAGRAQRDAEIKPRGRRVAGTPAQSYRWR